LTSVPEGWDTEGINHYFNESGWSLPQVLDQAVEWEACLTISAEYRREATAADETEQQMFVRRLSA